MNQEHHPKDNKTYNKGANADQNKEFLGAVGDGEYLDSRNIRLSSTKGQKTAAEQIGGEEELHTQNPVNGSYTNIGIIGINGKKVEFWAENSDSEPPIVRIDGVIVAQSNALGFIKGFPLQLDKNENCIGGEVFITDNNLPPMIFNIGDMLDSLTSNPNKYFSSFQRDLHEVNLASALDIPVFKAIENVGGGGGLPVGTYQYALRYVTEEGDRTNISPFTPPIPIVQNLSNDSEEYPGAKTYGGSANPEQNTRYAIKLKFRVTNIFNYDSIEIIRLANNSEFGINNSPNAFIVGRLGIDEEEISVREFIDPVDGTTAEPISFEEETRQVAYINKAKTIRYFDKRTVLMNVELESKESDLQFEEINGKKMFPIKENIGKDGYKDPYNFTYKKHYLGGEKYGFGIDLFDGVGSKGFVNKVDGYENVQIPNRREPTDSDTENYSKTSEPDERQAATINHTIEKTHEVFDTIKAIQKSDKESFKNIYDSQDVILPGATGLKKKTKVLEDSDESSSAEIETHGARVTIGNDVYPHYLPYSPTSKNDPDTSGHGYRSTVQVSEDGNASEDPVTGLEIAGGTAYNPQAFAPEYHATGMLLSGVDNFPKWAKAFSVVRTDPAQRVVAQGIGMYKLNPARIHLAGALKQDPTTKDLDKMWFFSPDIENGLVSSDVVNDMISNPENYSVQLVSPLGFFTELYSFEETTAGFAGDRLVDMISYAGFYRDKTGTSINPETGGPTWGIPNPLDSNDRHVGYSKWRGANAPGQGNLANGNNLFTLNAADRVTSGRGTYMEIQTDEAMYLFNSPGSDEEFEDPNMKSFHEPFYIINIVQNGKNVRSNNVQSYRSTGHYQKLESVIGEGNGLVDQEFELIDERWEDVIPALKPTDPQAADLRYLYLRKEDGTEEKYVNVTYKSPAEKSALLLDPEIEGLYTHTNINDKEFTIVFGEGQNPLDGDKIVIKYDKTAPIRFFGGDAVIGESLFSPLDNESGAKDNSTDTQFPFDMAWPYRKMKLNPRHYVITRTTGLNRIQDRSWCTLGWIRQLVVKFTCESRIATPFSHNLDYPLEFFPQTHYIMRPNRWKEFKDNTGATPDEEDESIYQANNIHERYVDDYGVDEYLRWKFGGFRFRQNINIDYSAQPPKNSFSKPAFGFEEDTKYCTRTMWSLPRAINQQDSPGLRTFPASNVFDISDDQGEIKKAYDEMSGRGDNLYAITENGVCMLLHKKSILTELTGEELAVTASDKFIQREHWISKHVGMNDEMWRSAAEGLASIESETDTATLDILAFANKNSVFTLVGGKITEIGRLKYYTELSPLLKNIGPGFIDKVAGLYNEENNEYWLDIQNQGAAPFRKVLVFDMAKRHWVGKFDYNFDNYLSLDRGLYGVRDLTTFDLDKGNLINGSPIQSWVLQVSAPEQIFEKEYIRINVNSDKKPKRIEFYDVNMNLLCKMDSATQGPLYLKEYDGFQQFIPRKDLVVSPNRELIQDRAVLYKIIWEDETEVYLTDTQVQYKVLK